MIGSKPAAVYQKLVTAGVSLSRHQVDSLATVIRREMSDHELIDLPREFKCIKDVRIVTHGRTNPTMIIASDGTLALLANPVHGRALYIDGTHSIVELGCQVLTISITIHNHGVRVAYLLTREKSQEAYTDLLMALSRMAANASIVKHVVLDHELALHGAVRAVWSCDVHLCYFHFVQALQKWFEQHHSITKVLRQKSEHEPMGVDGGRQCQERRKEQGVGSQNEFHQTNYGWCGMQSIAARVIDQCKRLFLANHVVVFDRELAALRSGEPRPPSEFMRYFENFWLGKENQNVSRWAIAFRTSADPRYNTNNISEAGHASMKGLLDGAKDLGLRAFVKFADAQLNFAATESGRIIDGKVAPKKPNVSPRTAAITASVNGIDAVKMVIEAVATGKRSNEAQLQVPLHSIESVPAPERLSSEHVFADHDTTMRLLAAQGLRALDVAHDGRCAFHVYAWLLGYQLNRENAELVANSICDPHGRNLRTGLARP